MTPTSKEPCLIVCHLETEQLNSASPSSWCGELWPQSLGLHELTSESRTQHQATKSQGSPPEHQTVTSTCNQLHQKGRLATRYCFSFDTRFTLSAIYGSSIRLSSKQRYPHSPISRLSSVALHSSFLIPLLSAQHTPIAASSHQVISQNHSLLNT